MNVGMISLGCAKNRIDGEMMLKMLTDAGETVCNNLADCQAVIVHTCTFIEAAKAESIDAILEAAAYKQSGKLEKLIVTGCLAEQYKEEIFRELPEVDAVLGAKSFDEILNALHAPSGFSHYRPLSALAPEYDRLLTTGNTSVYLRIGEGCSNHCTYCLIPSVRGEFQPRPFETVLAEAERLVADGAVEINLIAQDTTKHPDLCRIIRAIAAFPTVRWIRILYCRPEEISDELLETMAQVEKCVPYIDLPLQHASGKILKKMNRSGNDRTLLETLARIRAKLPGASLRTTFITGFPGETEEDFEILCQFVRAAKFHNLGVFPYSREAGTPAARMHHQVPQNVKERRAEIVMQIQHELLKETNSVFIGKTFDVLVTERLGKNRYVGRAYFQAPEVDGTVRFSSDVPLKEGTFAKVRLERYHEYDFYGKAETL